MHGANELQGQNPETPVDDGRKLSAQARARGSEAVDTATGGSQQSAVAEPEDVADERITGQ